MNAPVPGRIRMDTISNMTPSPPIHWVTLRHKIIMRSELSGLDIMLKPLPVHPDIASKKASRGDICWTMMNGIALIAGTIR